MGEYRVIVSRWIGWWIIKVFLCRPLLLSSYTIKVGAPEGAKDQGFSFTLITPERVFNLSSTSKEDRDEWIYHVRRVIQRELTPQDSSSE